MSASYVYTGTKVVSFVYRTLGFLLTAQRYLNLFYGVLSRFGPE